MDIDPKIATAFGFPKPEYVAIERERRWLCREVPHERIERTETITDLYVTGTLLRLREARPMGIGAPMLRLSRKVDVDPRTRLITSIYLTEKEYAVLAANLPGVRVEKVRHRLRSREGVSLLVDEFQGELAGLVLAEAEFQSPDQSAAFEAPEFVDQEVTEDRRFTSAHLAMSGLPGGWGKRLSGQIETREA